MMKKENLAALIRPTLSEDLLALCRRLSDAGEKAYLVGGYIRDLLLEIDTGDWDVATTARPEAVQKLFNRTIPTGIDHGTVTVRMGGNSYEVTTLRGDGAYSDGRRPDTVSFVSDIHEDLARRDFTINAIAYEPDTEKIHDPFHGIEDLEAHIIRAVGDPAERFAEDGLRCMRAARFSAVLDFEIEKETLDAIPGALATFRKVSPERIRMEFVKLLAGVAPERGLKTLLSSGLLEEIMPELAACAGSEQNVHHRYDVWEHSLVTCARLPASDPVLRLAGLVHDVGKPVVREMDSRKNDFVYYDHEKVGAQIVEEWMKKLRFSNTERNRVVHLVRLHGYHYTEEWTDAAVRRYIRKVGIENLSDLYALREADIMAHGTGKDDESLALLKSLMSRVDRELEQQSALSVSELAVSGADLMKGLNITPGPVIGVLLNMLLEHVMETPGHNDEQRLLELAASFLDEAMKKAAQGKESA